MKNISLFKLYLIFLKIGSILLGGGYVILPILVSELSEKRDLIDENELVDYFALSQSLPGIVAANISMFTGYKLCGKAGAVIAMLGIITVPFLIILFLSLILNNFAGNQYLSGIFWGIGLAVTVLIILSVREIWQKSDVNAYFCFIFIFTAFLLLYFKYSPVTAIIISSIAGVLIKLIGAKRSQK